MEKGPGITGSFALGVVSEAVTCSSLTTVGTAARQWDFAIHVLHRMQNRGVLLDGISWSANVAALASGHQWEKSLKVAAKTISTWDGISSALTSTILGACSEPWQVPFLKSWRKLRKPKIWGRQILLNTRLT